MRTCIARVLVLPVGVFGFVSSALAQGNMHLGTLEIKPFSSIEQKYNDNIYLEPKTFKNGDQITVYQVGLSLKKPVVPGKSLDFKAKYFADFIQFRKNDKEDRTDNTVSASLGMTMLSHIVFKVKENFKKTADPPTSELTDLEKRLRNDTIVDIGLKGDKMGLDAHFEYHRDVYDSTNLKGLDKKDFVIGPVAYLQVGPKTTIFAQWDFGQIRYDHSTSNLDSTYVNRNIGIRGKITRKLTGVIKAGRKTTDYEDNRNIEEDDKDFKAGVVFANITYQILPRTTINAYASKSSIESTFETNNFFVESKGGGQLKHLLMDRVTVFGGGYYQINKYPEVITFAGLTDERKDKLSGSNAGLKYELKKWLILEGVYNFSKKDSNFNDFDHKNNVYSGKLTILF